MDQQEKAYLLPASEGSTGEAPDSVRQGHKQCRSTSDSSQNLKAVNNKADPTETLASAPSGSGQQPVNVYVQSFTKDQMKALMGSALEASGDDLESLEKYREVSL